MRLVLFTLLFAAGPAWAQAPDDATEQARAHVKAGIAHYGDGRYEEAAREMEAAYGLKPLPDLQYNLAQCYERLNRLEDAAAAYRKYLDGKQDAEDRAGVEARVANLIERARLAKAGAPAPPPPPTEKVVFKTIIIYRETPPAPGRGARIAAYMLAVLAVGSLAAGITTSVLAHGDASQVTSGGSLTTEVIWNGQAQVAGQADVIVSYVSFAVAAAAAAGAIGLYALGSKIDREAPKLTLVPMLSPGLAAITLGGSF